MARHGRPHASVIVSGAFFGVALVASVLRPGWFVADLAPIVAATILAARAATLSGAPERPAWRLFTAGLVLYGVGEVGGPLIVATAVVAPILVSAGAVRLAWCAGAFADARATLNTLMSITSVVAVTLVVAPTGQMAGRPTLQGDMLVIWLTNAVPLTLLAGIMITVALQVGPRRAPWAVAWAATILAVLALITVIVLDSGTDAPPVLPSAWSLVGELAVWAGLSLPAAWVVATGEGLTTDLPPLRDSNRVTIWAVAAAVGALLLGVVLVGPAEFPVAAVVAPVVLLLALARVAQEAAEEAVLAATQAEAADAAARAAAESRAGEDDVLTMVHDVLNSLYAVRLAVETVDVGDSASGRAAVAEAAAACQALNDGLRREYSHAADVAAQQRDDADGA